MGKGQRPLSGTRVLVTRARRQAAEFSRLLRQQGATVVEIPLIEIVPPRSFRRLDKALKNLSRYQWLILTSVNGVEATLNRLRRWRIFPAKLKHLKIAAIGPATKKALTKAGGRVAITPPEYVAEAVVAALKDKVKNKRVLLIRAAVARDVIPRELRRAGAELEMVAAYETKLPANSATRLRKLLHDKENRPRIITFTSSSTVHHFVRASRGANLNGIALASIGPVTSATLRSYGLAPAIEAKSFTVRDLAQAIVQWGRSNV
jgi:uroporphyrinogen-III synthase